MGHCYHPNMVRTCGNQPKNKESSQQNDLDDRVCGIVGSSRFSIRSFVTKPTVIAHMMEVVDGNVTYDFMK